MDADGKVSCTFDTCTVVNVTADWVANFAEDNNLWIDEFSKAFQKMIESGWEQQQQDFCTSATQNIAAELHLLILTLILGIHFTWLSNN